MLRIIIKNAIFSLIILASCGKQKEITASDYLTKGIKNAKKRGFEACIYNLSKIDEKFPFSSESKEATPILIYCHYMQGNFANVHSMTENFESLYPTNPQNAYLTYLRAISYYRSFKNYRKSQDNLTQIMLMINKINQIAPNSIYAQNLEKLIPHIEKFHHQHELYTAQHYLQTHNYISAAARISAIYPHIQDPALQIQIEEYMQQTLANLGVKRREIATGKELGFKKA